MSHLKTFVRTLQHSRDANDASYDANCVYINTHMVFFPCVFLNYTRGVHLVILFGFVTETWSFFASFDKTVKTGTFK